jgi:hypothetical protein
MTSTAGAMTDLLGDAGASQGGAGQPAGAGSTAPAAANGQGSETLIAVPAGLFGTLIGLAGRLVGDAVGGSTGQTISDIGQTVSAVSPFSVVPGSAGQPQSNGSRDETMIAVPAGLFGTLIGLAGRLVGGAVGGSTGQTISDIGQTVSAVSPFSVIPGAHA